MAERRQQQTSAQAPNSRPFSFQVPPDDPTPVSQNARQPTDVPSTSSTPQPQPGPIQIDVSVQNWVGNPEQQRFSYAETPIEDNTQTFDDDEQRNILEEAQRRYGGASGAQPAQASSFVDQVVGQQAQGEQQAVSGASYPRDKQAPERMPSAYSQPPPTQPHPAMSAPYAGAAQQAPLQSGIPQQEAPKPMPSPHPSHSPGATPHKDPIPFNPNRSSTAKPNALTPTPAPFSPYTATPPDLTTAHRPGQIAHPSMNRVPTSNNTKKKSHTDNHHHTSSSWQHSLCACPPSDIPTCLLSLSCPCILHGRVAYRLSQRSRRADPTDLLGYSACNSACVGFAALCVCGLCGVLAGILRGRVRRAYGVQGGTGGDCAEGCCCFCCVGAQEDREIRAREEGARRWGGPGPGLGGDGVGGVGLGAGVAMEEYGKREGMRYPGAAV